VGVSIVLLLAGWWVYRGIRRMGGVLWRRASSLREAALELGVAQNLRSASEGQT